MHLDERSDQFWAITNPGANVTVSSFSSRIPTSVSPEKVTVGVNTAGDGVIGCGQTTGLQSSGGSYSPRWIMLIPFGVGAADTTMNLRVLGWTPTIGLGGGSPQQLWIPTNLGTYQATMGGSTGVAGADIGSGSNFADGITLTDSGPSFINSAAPNTIPPIIEGWFIQTVVDDGIAMLSVPTFGFRFIEVIFNTNSSVTSCNALYRKR
jgi:hypothetical protein